ncbi:MAG: hypothetical protein A3G11_02465 [Candidatus Lloydbacteria bacterium RIFCSPLOWO2_12_FULL_51_9]|uniref:Dihydrolipoamide acetyltransferase component of pyruvate dehydrogenase complex n=2 Tax=Candidatus Lloydiibacteriota TaxID=1817910 RepID=A0A1G2DVN9_9BACT|nr:MAG: hypothetical protein A3J08_03100 [Candidatus Lloydbacteria bacterium RIFCSPLOWO2_02_FULL_51_11]OGZ16960.1 MAG: hypothetical protein A3G11_02465 [Candidatus Lloydbacteria bacterium RIFCSPLOWO2_12_FULL_51_9]
MARIAFGVTKEVVSGGTGTYSATLDGVYPVLWHKKRGELVTKGEEIATVETDKVVLSITAPVSGILVVCLEAHEWSTTEEILLTPYGTILVPPLGEIETEGGEKIHAPPPTPLARKMIAAHEIDAAALTGTGTGGRVQVRDVEHHLARGGHGVRAVPAARVSAREQGLDLGHVKGNGPDGLVLASDIVTAHAKDGGEIQKPLPSGTTGLRRTVARLLTRSWREIPLAGDMMSVHVGTLKEFLKRYTVYGEPFSHVHLRLEYVVAWEAMRLLATSEFSALNGYWNTEKEEAVVLPSRNIGFAVNTPRGLMVPVVRDVGARSFLEFATCAGALIENTVSGHAAIGDFRDLTFTVNNTGVLGGENPAPLIPYTVTADGSERPTGMILALAKMSEREGEIILPIVFRFDHRLCDGGPASAFVRALKERIETPRAPHEFFSLLEIQ